ncbi:trypsin-like peptidase domain-containing protein [bacterium]|nr:trypsin-like peptidase domain-containing protein [bacterium]
MYSRIVAAGVFVLLLSMSAQAAPKMQDRPDLGATSTFGRNLVEKVRKGAVYISAMASQGGPLQEAWIGSGFIFQAVPEENAAYVLTNHHVAQETAILQIETWDHSTYKGQLVATEPGIDVALVKVFDIPPDAYEVNVMGDSDKVQIGDAALAIGAPGSADSALSNRSDPFITFGLHQTTTMRVVMGKHAEPFEYIGAWASWRTDLGQQVMTNCPYRFVVQSAINGGNSGGPLYNADGEVIGLNHAHFGAGSVITQNENYTIPVNFARKFAYDILNNGKHEIPWFGMDMIFPPEYIPQSSADGGAAASQAMTEWVEKHYEPDVLRVLSVREDSPAERAGLKKGDVILEFDDRHFDTIIDLRLYIFEMPIGKQVPVSVRRGRDKVDLTLEVGVKRGYNSEFSL